MASEPSTSTTETVTKTLYLIRHAESEENRRLASLQTVVSSLLKLSWPSSNDIYAALELIDVYGQVDSPVSQRGRWQISHARDQLNSQGVLRDPGIQAVLHSPLQRAKDTCLGLFDGSNQVAPIEETPLLLEKTPAEWVLSKSFVARLQAFQEHVLARPEERLVVVGHSQFFKALLKLNFKFGNCDVWKVELRGSCLEPGAQEALPPQWCNLQHLLACSGAGDDDPSKRSSG